MILEIADFRIQPGKNNEFDEAIARGVRTVIAEAKGFRGFRVVKGIESIDRYQLMIWWDTLDNHTVDFRGSAAFADWRAIVGPFFASPPSVEHFERVAESEPAAEPRR